MPSNRDAIFAALRAILSRHAEQLRVKADTEIEYTVLTRAASPFPQHKGEPLFFGSVRNGKAYVSFHLIPLYMCPELKTTISPALKKRMQGKSCFNFKNDPEPDLVAELERLTQRALTQWSEREWL